jgi:hypothetical protein
LTLKVLSCWKPKAVIFGPAQSKMMVSLVRQCAWEWTSERVNSF